MLEIVKIMAVLALVVSLVLSFGAGCALENSALSRNEAAPESSVSSRPELSLEVIEETWNIIFRDYVDRDKLDADALKQAAIKGILEAINDPYTSYLDAQHYQMSEENLSGKFDGIGAYVGLKDGQLTVISPMPGSPAERAGIRAGDIILEVDGKDTSVMSLDEAVLNIRGPRGTTVRLLVLHQGDAEPLEMAITRAEIKITSVYFEMKEDIAYININSFSERTDEELVPALEALRQEGATGIVLDLRNNPGGLLDEVVDVAGRFLSEGIVLYVVDNHGGQTSRTVKPGGVTTALPMVVLVSSYTASGGEVLSGALQGHGRAPVAGAVTYGKGSVNNLHRLKDGSGLYITTARWLTPSGHLIEGEGIIPDYELKLEGEEAIQWAIDYLKGNQG